jgi:heme o synthase
MTDISAQVQTGEAGFGDYVALLKPRVMSLVVFTAVVGLLVAPVSVHPVLGLIAILFIALGAGASGALNMWWDADIDAVMRRTQNRPVPSGKVQPGEALGLGMALSGIAVVMLWLAANAVAAGLLAFTIFFYAVVYSMWLKRTTPQNIVIGGAAGAFPPMIGWAVATGGVSVESALMFALIFMWTPPHFWALALFMKEDYHTAGIACALSGIGGPLTLAVAVVLNGWFVVGAWRIWQRDEAMAEADKYKVEKAVFRFSLSYLFLHFSVFLVEAVLKSYGLGGW